MDKVHRVINEISKHLLGAHGAPTQPRSASAIAWPAAGPAEQPRSLSPRGRSSARLDRAETRRAELVGTHLVARLAFLDEHQGSSGARVVVPGIGARPARTRARRSARGRRRGERFGRIRRLALRPAKLSVAVLRLARNITFGCCAAPPLSPRRNTQT